MLKSGTSRINLFKWIAFGLVVFLFLAIEITVRILVPDNQIQERLVDLGELNFFSKVTIKGEPSIQITSKYGYSDQRTTFKERKMPGTYRIFCIGGSASAGWPHPFSERFSTYLDTCLKRIYPEKKIEIVNCSAHGFASYRVREVFHQLISYEPDAVILWSGNNEFLEDQRFKSGHFQQVVDRAARKIRMVQLIKQAFPQKKLDGNEIDVANSFWKKSQQQALELCTDSGLALKVRQVYAQSIDEIATEADDHRIKVILLTVPVNLKDWQPNVSYCSLKGQDSLNWSKEYNKGCRDLLHKDFIGAIESFRVALSTEPKHAMSYFLMARAFEQAGDSIAAFKNYMIAKDLDYNPFRAISDFNESVKQIAGSHSNCFLFDAEKLFTCSAVNGIPGFDLFLDYVHPTRKGNLILACNLAESIRKTNVLSLGSSLVKVDTSSIGRMLVNYSEATDVSLQMTRFSLCCLTHQYESAITIGNKLLANMPDEYTSDPANGLDLKKLKEGVERFSIYQDEERKMLEENGNRIQMVTAKLGLKQFYETYYPYGSF